MSVLTASMVVPLLIAAGLLAAGWVWRIRFRNLRRAVQTNCAGVAGLRDGVPCQVSGTALAVRPAPFSGRPCAWYKTKATARTKAGKRVFIDEKSTTPFSLRDGTGHVVIDPSAAAVDGAVQTMDERRSTAGELPGVEGEVAEYRYEEWILPAGRPLYVLGTATCGSVGKDKETGQYAISTRTRREYRRRAVMFMGIGYGGGVGRLPRLRRRRRRRPPLLRLTPPAYLSRPSLITRRTAATAISPSTTTRIPAFTNPTTSQDATRKTGLELHSWQDHWSSR